MHDLSPELRALPADASLDVARAQALRLERREVFSVRRELLVTLYAAVATLVGGVGWLIRNNLDRIGPLTLLLGIFAASILCYAWAWRPQARGRERSLGLDYVLLLAALLFSTGVGYAEVKFHVFGPAWSRHLLLLAVWHLATAYFFRSKLVLSVALTAFAGWLGVEASLGSIFESRPVLLRAGPRALLCAALFWLGAWIHGGERSDGFREVYRQFAANFGFWGALALGGDPTTRWVGAAVLLALVIVVGRIGLAERRQSFLLYAVGYGTIGLVWLEALLLGGVVVASGLGLFTVIGAVVLLMNLRARLKESAG